MDRLTFVRDKFFMEKGEYPLPFFNDNNIAISFIADVNYLSYAMVLLENIIQKSNESYNYDIVILTEGISESILNICCLKLQLKSNFSLRFLDHSYYLEEKKNLDTQIWGMAIFYRLMITEIFQSYNKLLVLDTDLLILKDLSVLWFIDIEEYLLAAAPDHMMSVTNKPKKLVKTDFYSGSYFDYYTKYLGLKDLTKQFNNGVLLFNLKKVREKKIDKKILATLDDPKKYIGIEEDHMNRVFNDQNIFILGNEWNCLYYSTQNILKLEDSWFDDCARQFTLKAMESPAILHPLISPKFWNFLDEKDYYSILWWQIASASLLYPVVLDKYIKNQFYFHSLKSQIKRKIHKILPTSSPIGRILRKIYRIFRRS